MSTGRVYDPVFAIKGTHHFPVRVPWQYAAQSNPAYEAGCQALAGGRGFLDNPYPDGSTEFRRYVDGLVDAIKATKQPQIQADAHTAPA